MMDMSSFLNTYMLLNFRDGFNMTTLYIPLFIFILQYIATNPKLIWDKIKYFVVKQKQCIKTYTLNKVSIDSYAGHSTDVKIIEALYFYMLKI